jgi:hypothetical protein
MNARRIWLAAIAAAALAAVIGAYLLLDDRGAAEARAWAENHPTFDQVPQDHWRVTADQTSSLGPLDGRLLPQWSSTVAQRRTVWDVPGDDFNTVVDHIASLVQHDGTPTEAFGNHWYEQPGSTTYGFTTDFEQTNDRTQLVSIDVIDAPTGVEVIISASQSERYARR